MPRPSPTRIFPDLLAKAARRLALPTDVAGEGAEILLDTIPLPSTGCVLSSDSGASEDGKALGFRLILRRPNGGIRTLHVDTRLPKSRECPSGYGIAAVYVARPPGKPPVLAVLLQRFSPGWEGPDRRFLAVTAVLEP